MVYLCHPMKKIDLLKSDKSVAIWIMVGVGMLIIQILLGGITRLTGSGLSITQWDVITGTLPPLNQHQWLDEFSKYRQTPQFRLLNSDFNLHDFKSIFFWEWFHRLWGRLIGIVFLFPFIIFLLQKKIRHQMVRPLVILFLLGALQGAIGWIMVASGLTGDAIYVKPAKLAMHFVLACILISYAYWFGLQLLVKKQDLVFHPSLKKNIWVIVSLLFIQLIFGALMAGHKAATAAPTWPDINGSFIPSYVFSRPEGMISIIKNPVVIQFIHRSIAYIIALLTLIWTFRALKINASRSFSIVRVFPCFLVCIQVFLGILTVLTSIQIRVARWNIFEWMAQLHQLVAILFLLSLLTVLYYLQRKQKANLNANIDPQLI